MKDQVERRVACLVPAAEIERDFRDGRKMWFLPHFAVLKNSETTPVCVVFDGKARYQEHALNDYLAKGDNLNTKLFDVAPRFRKIEVGVIADVRKMFQAVKVTPEDARIHRYSFRQRPEDSVYELTTVTFRDKSSPTAATVALRHVAMENAPNNSNNQHVIEQQFYVDNLTESQRTIDDVCTLKQKLTTTLDKGRFIIRHWLSNEKKICDPDCYPRDNMTTVLGTKWNLQEDTLQVKEVATIDFVATKRNILKKVAFYYKLNWNTVSKGYCAVFVCAVLGPVHLTCVQYLSTLAFLQALERFISTRGSPARLISDNATCFRGADNKIRGLQLHLDQDQLQSENQKYNLEWRFGPPAGPHHQGLVERMVQELKRSMKYMVKADKLIFVEWETVFSVIAGLLNSCPIVAVFLSPLDKPSITLNHFLIGRGSLPNVQVPCEEYVGNTRKCRELCGKMVDSFWCRWTVNFVCVVDVRCSGGLILKRLITKLMLLMKRTGRTDM